MEYSFKDAPRACVWAHSAVCYFRECIVQYFIHSNRTSRFILRAMTVCCCIISPAPSLSLSQTHTQARAENYTSQRFHIQNHRVWLAAMASAMRNDKIFCYLLTLRSIWGDGVSRGSSALKVMLSNKAPQTPVKWSHYIKAPHYCNYTSPTVSSSLYCQLKYMATRNWVRRLLSWQRLDLEEALWREVVFFIRTMGWYWNEGHESG